MTLATSLERVLFRTNETTPGDSILMLRSHRGKVIVPAEPIIEKDCIVLAYANAGSGTRQDICAEFSAAVELIAADLTFAAGLAAGAANFTNHIIGCTDGAGGAFAPFDTLTNAVLFVARTPKNFTIVPATDRIIAGGHLALLMDDETAVAGQTSTTGMLHVLAHQLDYSTELVLMEAERDMHLYAIGVTARSTVAFDAANYVTLDVGVADGVGGAPASFDTMTTETVALTARTTRNFAAIVPATDAVPAGSNLVLTITKAGTGVWLPELSFDIYYTND